MYGRFMSGVPNLQDLRPDDRGGTDVIIIEIKCMISKIYLSHSETIPSIHGEIVFHEANPWCKIWGPLLYTMKHERDDCVKL